MKRLTLIFLMILTPICLLAQFSGMEKEEKVEVFADKSTYKTEIMRLILESSGGKQSIIIKGANTLKADTIIYDDKEKTGYAYGNVYFENKDDDMLLQAGQGTYYTERKEVMVRENPVLRLGKDGTTAKSDVMNIYTERQIIVFTGNVVINNGENIIKGNKATYYSDTGKFNVIGDAVALQEGNTLNADKLDATSRDGQLQNYIARGNVFVENVKEGYTIFAGKMDYDKAMGFTRLSEKPVVLLKDKNNPQSVTELLADKIDMTTQNEGVSGYKATGNVYLKNDAEGYDVRAQTLDHNKSTGFTKLTGEPFVILNDKDGSKTELNAEVIEMESGNGTMNTKDGGLTKLLTNATVKMTDVSNNLTILIGERIETRSVNGVMETIYAVGNVYMEDQKNGYTVVCDKLDHNKKKGFTLLDKNANVKMNDQNGSYSEFSADRMEMQSSDGEINSKGKSKTKLLGNSSILMIDTNAQMTKMTAKNITIDSDKGEARKIVAVDNVLMIDEKEGYVIRSGKMQYYKHRGYAKITKKPMIFFEKRNMRAYAVTMEKFDQKNQANLSGNVVIIDGDKRKAYADWAEYKIEKGLIHLKGNPLILEGDKKFRANQIDVNIDDGTMEMVGGGSGIY